MNRTLINVYLNHRKPQWGKGLEGMSFDSDRDLEDIVLGNVEERDKERERYLSEELDRELDKAIRD